jgi:hypothetical protein
MNMQGQHLFDTRGVRIAMIAVAAVIALAVAAYFFGTGLRADTAASVAHSPLGSSLTAVRESISKDYVGRLINASAAARAASLAALAKSRADFYADLNNSAAAPRAASSAASQFADRYDRMNSSSAAARAASLAALAKSRTDFYADLNNSPAVARAAWLKLMESTGSADYAARAGGLWFDIPAAAIMASRPAGSQSSNSGSSAAVRGASLAELAGIWAPFYAGLDKAMTDAGARPAQGTSNSMAESSAEEQFQWIKPEEIKPSEIIGPAAGQNPWIKPEGIRSK